MSMSAQLVYERILYDSAVNEATGEVQLIMGFLELRQAPGVYSRVTTGMPILNGSLFSEVRTLV